VATLAYRGEEAVAGTINFEKGPHLYGRYWGCVDDFQMLHFELCYYRLIERAIERRHTLFEAGAQGEHKLKRGLAPAFTHSAHWIREPALASAIRGVHRTRGGRGGRGGAPLRTAFALSRAQQRR
jgi:predicted N-acyltransferase